MALSIEAKAELDLKVELELSMEAKAELDSKAELDLCSKNLDLINSLTGFIPSTE